ncbi:hypothetical protein CPC08DRAFT_704558 [Agrocybe pediades]|nr:hypothetical protein CPC08DRAFT_704558 [Agrocybe pediades]
MSLFLCVDCGGTKTAAAIADADGKIVGRGSGGPSNITYLSPERFILSAKEAILTALKTARPSEHEVSNSLPPTTSESPFAAAWFGISGADSPAAIERVAPLISALLGLPIGSKLVIANDTHLLAAPLRIHSDVSQAIAVISGTGSIAVSFAQGEGKIEEMGRVGGWGWILGDEGSGFDVGREALRQILRAQDKSTITGTPLPPSTLIDRILETFGVTSVMEILGGVYLADPVPDAPNDGSLSAFLNRSREKRISSLPPLIFDSAFEHKDPLAIDIVKACAGHLGDQIGMLLGDGVEGASRSVVADQSVLSFGGSLVGVEAYRQLVVEDIAKRGHIFRRVVFISDAAEAGAVGLSVSMTTA